MDCFTTAVKVHGQQSKYTSYLFNPTFLLSEGGREGRLLSNPFGVSGHDWCRAGLAGEEERRGECYNELECLATGGQIQGYCHPPVGSNILVSQSPPHPVLMTN